MRVGDDDQFIAKRRDQVPSANQEAGADPSDCGVADDAYRLRRGQALQQPVILYQPSGSENLLKLAVRRPFSVQRLADLIRGHLKTAAFLGQQRRAQRLDDTVTPLSLPVELP